MCREDKLQPGRAVISGAGHDRGRYLLILGRDCEYLYLADGIHSTAQKPKKKKIMHVILTRAYSAAVKDIILKGDLPDDELVRKELENIKKQHHRETEEC